MTTVFNWGNVFQLIVDGFDQHPFAQEQFVVEPDQAWFHVPLDWGEQFYTALHQPRQQVFGQIAFITDQFAKEALSQLWNWAAIIHVARGEAASEEVAAVVDDQMQFEAVKPIDRILAALGQSSKDPMVVDAAVVTDHQFGRIDKREAVTRPSTGLQVCRQWRQDGRDELHEAIVTDQPRKVPAQGRQNVPSVERLEVAIVRLMKVDQDGHNFAFGELAAALALDLPCLEQGVFPRGSKGFPKVIDMAKQFE